MDFLCAATAGMLARYISHPLDSIKTVAFTADTTVRHSFLAAANVINRREGYKGFYRGVGVAVLGAAPGTATYVIAYEQCKAVLDVYCSPVFSSFMSGFVAEACSCVFWVPIDVTKERLQQQAPAVAGRYQSSFHAITTILREEKLRGLYKGYFATLGSFGPFSAVFFTFYEIFSQFLIQYNLNSFYHNLIAAFAGNLIASISTNPLELVKTRIQVQSPVLRVHGERVVTNVASYHYKTFMDGFRSIVRDEGFLGLWRGTGARCAYAAPNSALTFAFYQSLKKLSVAE